MRAMTVYYKTDQSSSLCINGNTTALATALPIPTENKTTAESQNKIGWTSGSSTYNGNCMSSAPTN